MKYDSKIKAKAGLEEKDSWLYAMVKSRKNQVVERL